MSLLIGKAASLGKVFPATELLGIRRADALNYPDHHLASSSVIHGGSDWPANLGDGSWSGAVSTLDPATITSEGVPAHGVRLYRFD